MLSLARRFDRYAASRAPLDLDGAHPRTHVAERTLRRLQEIIQKPAITPADLPAFWDAIEHASTPGLDDRKMLLEKLLVAMSRLKDYSISLDIQQAVINILYKDLPHPPNGFLCPFEMTKTLLISQPNNLVAPPTMPKNIHYAYRAADGSNYNPLVPGIGRAGSPYARSVPSTNLTPRTTLPDPHLVFDTLLKRDTFTPHPDGISSLFFAFANLIIHDIFNTNRSDWRTNDASSYLDLSILYGSSEEQLSKVRTFDGSGRLMPDTFADGRLLMMPPASCALLVLLSRNHNYIAQKLLDINEFQHFKHPSELSEDEKRIQDDEIFNRTRLVNCGYFMQIILGDYVGAILGLVRDGSDWRLNPLMNMREVDHDIAVRGEGNVVSIEFNLLYRWHSTLSQQNVSWIENEFAKVFPKDANEASISAFKAEAGAAMAQRVASPPNGWNFGGISRGSDGRFRDVDLARILQSVTQDVAGAFKARGIPECMRVIEVMGIMQSRAWGTCSLNEFRKFMGLKPYSSFKEWNPNPKIHVPAASLYKDIDRLELHVGLQAEEAKTPGPGAGMCPGYTISRAILADAVCLTRGDRFLTTDFTPFNLTAWGYQDCQYDHEDGSFGGMLTKLLFRTLPDHYPAGSALAHFPFTIPEKMYTVIKAKGDGSIDNYRWPGDLINSAESLPPVRDHVWKVVSDLAGVKDVLGRDATEVAKRQEIVVEPILKKKQGLSCKKTREKQAQVTQSIMARDKWAQYFNDKTERLLQAKKFDQVGNDQVCYVDIVKDVIDLLPVHWICEEVAHLPLKSHCNPEGEWREEDTCAQWADVARYIYMNFDPANDFKLRERSQKTATEIIDIIREHLNDSERRFVSLYPTRVQMKPWLMLRQASIGCPFEYIGICKKPDSIETLRGLHRERGLSHTELAISVFYATVPTAALFSKAIAQVVDYFLAEENQQARKEIEKIFLKQEKDASAKIMGYVREALRLNPIFAGVYRVAKGGGEISGHHIQLGDHLFVDIATANNTLKPTPDYARPTEKQGILSPYNDGMLSPEFFEAVVPGIIGTILTQKGLKRAEGESGTLTKFDEKWHGTDRREYVNISGLVTPWPDAMIVGFEPKPTTA
ncbi:heme peroxidase [Macrolepiota fuliginosa MF-IS2]|uniref:Heme peroxidase n=1 Tax=Macrolepiota fuliginosa MF-IS2 TaxID=1400762 RepID=A0A9P6C3M9_9AGAR|nr:heme peroxidase [Macrolepiota fuliginosa MF-IS2]